MEKKWPEYQEDEPGVPKITACPATGTPFNSKASTKKAFSNISYISNIQKPRLVIIHLWEPCSVTTSFHILSILISTMPTLSYTPNPPIFSNEINSSPLYLYQNTFNLLLSPAIAALVLIVISFTATTTTTAASALATRRRRFRLLVFM